MACSLDTETFNGAGRSDAGGRRVAAETAFTHACRARQGRERQVGIEMFADPAMEGCKPVFARLEVQGGAELGLSAGALEEDHKVARDGKCDLAAEIVFEECQCEVDA